MWLTLFLALRWTPNSTIEQVLTIAATIVVAHYIAAEFSGLYRSWRGASVGGELRCVLLSWAYTAVTVLGVGLITSVNAQVTYESKLIWIFGTPLVMGLARYVVRTILHGLRARGFNAHTFAVCGVNELGEQLVRNIQNSPEMGMRFVGFFDDRPSERTSTTPGTARRVGGINELVEQARRGAVDRIYITFPMRAEQRIRDVLARLGDSTASVYIVPDFFVFELLSARWTNINGLPAVSVFESPLHGADGVIKRVADILLGLLILTVVALPMAVIGLLVKLTSPGPVFFRQKRYGLDGREILVWKFRSMTCCENGSSIHQATRDDKRVTRLGQFLRRTSLDELPQLFNVLEGTMSLVGPRPHANAHNEQYRSLINGYMLRHKVKPGITGLAQVNGLRGETETLEKMQARVRCDHEYIREWSLWMDLKILCRTVFVVLRQQNAY